MKWKYFLQFIEKIYEIKFPPLNLKYQPVLCCSMKFIRAKKDEILDPKSLKFTFSSDLGVISYVFSMGCELLNPVKISADPAGLSEDKGHNYIDQS